MSFLWSRPLRIFRSPRPCSYLFKSFCSVPKELQDLSRYETEQLPLDLKLAEQYKNWKEGKLKTKGFSFPGSEETQKSQKTKNENQNKNQKKKKPNLTKPDERYEIKIPELTSPWSERTEAEKEYVYFKRELKPELLKSQLAEQLTDLDEKDFKEARLASDEEVMEMFNNFSRENPEYYKELRKYVFQFWTSIRSNFRANVKDLDVYRMIKDLEIEFEGKPDYQHFYTSEQFEELFGDMGGNLSEQEKREMFPDEYEILDWEKQMEESARRLEAYEKIKKSEQNVSTNMETMGVLDAKKENLEDFAKGESHGLKGAQNLVNFVNSFDVQKRIKEDEELNEKKRKLKEQLGKYGNKGIKKL